MKRASLVVLISGNGSNLQAVLDASRNGTLDADVVAVVSNKAGAVGLERAKKAGVPAIVFPKSKEETREVYDARLADLVEGYHRI
jgi:phosphoribosylglycinamide formyltransferase-1